MEETARILAESFEAGANISEVARRHGVVRGLLSAWRRKFATAAGTQAPGFVPVRIDAGSGPGTAGEADGVAPARTRLPEMASRVARLCGAAHESDGYPRRGRYPLGRPGKIRTLKG